MKLIFRKWEIDGKWIGKPDQILQNKTTTNKKTRRWEEEKKTQETEKIKEKGLAKGGSLDNAIVVKGNEILNSEKLRNPKEFVNHKILDCIGDLFTSGYRMIASIKCSQGCHYFTNNLLREVFADKENFSIIEIQGRMLPHTLINRSLLRSIA